MIDTRSAKRLPPSIEQNSCLFQNGSFQKKSDTLISLEHPGISIISFWGFPFLEDVTLVDSPPPHLQPHRPSHDLESCATWEPSNFAPFGKRKTHLQRTHFLLRFYVWFSGVYTNCLDVSFQVLNQHCTPKTSQSIPRISRNFKTASL